MNSKNKLSLRCVNGFSLSCFPSKHTFFLVPFNKNKLCFAFSWCNKNYSIELTDIIPYKHYMYICKQRKLWQADNMFCFLGFIVILQYCLHLWKWIFLSSTRKKVRYFTWDSILVFHWRNLIYAAINRWKFISPSFKYSGCISSWKSNPDSFGWSTIYVTVPCNEIGCWTDART